MAQATDTDEDLKFGPGSDMSEEQQQAIRLRADGATYEDIAFELGITEEQAKAYAPFRADLTAVAERDELRLTLVMGDRGRFCEAMEKHGLGLREILNQLRACLYAKRFLFDGKKTVAVPDYKTQMTAIRAWLHATGILGDRDKEDQETSKPVEVHLHYKTAEKVERLVGRKIIDVKGEASDDKPVGKANGGLVPADIGRGLAPARPRGGRPLGTVEVHRSGPQPDRKRRADAAAPDGADGGDDAGRGHDAAGGAATSRGSGSDSGAGQAVDIGAEW